MSLTRRRFVGSSLPFAVLASSQGVRAAVQAHMTVERWGMVEISLSGPRTGNPFVDVTLFANFEHESGQKITAPGFYDGDGIYRIRFSPMLLGNWRWTSNSNTQSLHMHVGSVLAISPGPDNHGPVQVSEDGYHFRYADGLRYNQVGTTCYAWAQQAEARVAQTLSSLKASPFNKLRMCVFPNVAAEPISPFEKTGSGVTDWDPLRFNPAFFQRFEDRVAQLQRLGIEADIILFHPYNSTTGYCAMTREHDELYVRYVMARLGAYRNVWWSMANEFDFLKWKTTADFDYLFTILQAEDPYNRLRSIHNGRRLYDNRKPWITHASIQSGIAVDDDARALIYREVWEKPVIFDEVCYEGVSEARWGRLTAEEMTARFWHGLVAGCYVGHGETFPQGNGADATDRGHPDDSWVGKGGKLLGGSPPRLAFLKHVMAEGPEGGFNPIDSGWGRHLCGQPGKYYLRYFGAEAPDSWQVVLPHDGLVGGERFQIQVLDTFLMTVTPVTDDLVLKKMNAYDFGAESGAAITLPGKPWQAVRLTLKA